MSVNITNITIVTNITNITNITVATNIINTTDIDGDGSWGPEYERQVHLLID